MHQDNRCDEEDEKMESDGKVVQNRNDLSPSTSSEVAGRFLEYPPPITNHGHFDLERYDLTL